MALSENTSEPAEAGALPSTPRTSRMAAPPATPYGAWLLPAYLASLVLVFIGERIVSAEGARYAFTGLGLLGATVTTAARFALSGTARGERGRAERVLAFCSTGGLVALGVYFATTDTGKRIFGIAAAKPETRARIESATTIAWVAILVISVLPLVFGELALGPMRRAAMIEARRVRAALRSGFVLGCAALYCALFTYAAGEVDAKVDFSYFRTARPSDSTKKIAAASSEAIQIKSFFPELNEVGTEVNGYLRDVARGAAPVKVDEYDRLLVPAVAKEAKVTTDGIVVLSRGATRETLSFGTEMKGAANKLKTLDGDFQKALLKVMRQAHVAYLTIGHGELNEITSDPRAEGRSGKILRQVLESQNYTMKDLGLIQGLGVDVPADATMVVVFGPSQPFLPEELEALKRYADRGGHLLLALDSEPKVDLAPLAAIVGVTWIDDVLATDRPLLGLHHNDSDRTILVTNRFSSHASVSTLSRNSSVARLIFLGAVALDKKADAPADLKIDFTVKSLAETFDDKNGNFQLDPGEKRTTYNLAAAVSRAVPAPPDWKGKDPPELRAFVVGDADVFSDLAISSSRANELFAVDAIRWLGGEESFSGAITNAEDVRIEHTKQKDQVWFYATIFGAPLLILGVGLAVSRRRLAVRDGGSRPQTPGTKVSKEEKRA